MYSFVANVDAHPDLEILDGDHVISVE